MKSKKNPARDDVVEAFKYLMECAGPDAFSDPVRLVIDDDTALQGRKGLEDGGRACACASEGTVFVTRALVESGSTAKGLSRIKGVLAHELGHVYLMQLGEPNHSERDADTAAEKLFGVRIAYDDDDVQTTGRGVRPRPRKLDMRENPKGHAGCVVMNPSATEALASMVEECDVGDFEEYYGEDPEEVRQQGEVRHGRKVVWVGSPGRMIEVDKNYVVPIQGNIWNAEKMAAVSEVVRTQSAPTESGKPVLYVGYGTVQVIDATTVREGIGNEDDEVPLERELDASDIGKLLYTIRDGNHRTFGALIGGESNVWMNLDDNQFQDVEQWRNKRQAEYLKKDKRHNKLMKLLDAKLRED